MQNPITAMADDATRWADEVFEAVRLNKPDDPRHPPIDAKPALKALAGFKPEDAEALAIGSTDDADAREAIEAAAEACEAFAASAMSASGPADLTEAYAGLRRAMKTLRRYAATAKTTGKAEGERLTDEPQAPQSDAVDPDVVWCKSWIWPVDAAGACEVDKRTLMNDTRIRRLQAPNNGRKYKFDIEAIARIYGDDAAAIINGET